MHPGMIAFVVVAAVAGVAVGYGFRGFIGRELVASKTELTGFAGRLEAAVSKDVNSAKTEILAIATAMRNKVTSKL